MRIDGFVGFVGFAAADSADSADFAAAVFSAAPPKPSPAETGHVGGVVMMKKTLHLTSPLQPEMRRCRRWLVLKPQRVPLQRCCCRPFWSVLSMIITSTMSQE
jgi:hypothetical protein